MPARFLNQVTTLWRESQVGVADLPCVNAHGFDDVFEAMLRPWRLGSTVFVGFGALSVIVSGVGLSVVAAYVVARRTREIGIRSALAPSRDISCGWSSVGACS
jgi:ABC-type antimicrobial peptide transport system permease subunit